jgi:hypothetical protein
MSAPRDEFPLEGAKLLPEDNSETGKRPR